MDLIRSFRGKVLSFEGSYSTWEQASALSSGYDASSILDAVLSATLKVKSGQAAFERDSVIFKKIEYSWPATSALLWAAARNNGVLNVLDFGGSLGSTYFQNRIFLSALKTVKWNIVEQSHFVEIGKKHIEDEVLKFHLSIEDMLKIVSPNVILFSSVAQYLPNINNILEQINSISADVLIFDRTPFSELTVNKICIQHVPGEIYNASYPMWILSRHAVISKLSNWKVCESFPSAEGRIRLEPGTEFEFSGYILERVHA